MMSPIPTPGPYSVAQEEGELLIVAPDPSYPGAIGLVAQVFECDFPDQALANARTLASAHDLLVELKALLNAMSPKDRQQHSANIRRAEAAIAKAEGTR